MVNLTENDARHLTYFLVIYAEILVLGTGARLERINPSVLALLKSKGIAVEVQDTVKYAQCLSVLKYTYSSSMIYFNKDVLADQQDFETN